MPEIIDYQVVSSRGKNEFETLVKREILRGWIPCGGVCVDKEHYYQAMVEECDAGFEFREARRLQNRF